MILLVYRYLKLLLSNHRQYQAMRRMDHHPLLLLPIRTRRIQLYKMASIMYARIVNIYVLVTYIWLLSFERRRVYGHGLHHHLVYRFLWLWLVLLCFGWWWWDEKTGSWDNRSRWPSGRVLRCTRCRLSCIILSISNIEISNGAKSYSNKCS